MVQHGRLQLPPGHTRADRDELRTRLELYVRMGNIDIRKHRHLSSSDANPLSAEVLVRHDHRPIESG
jgi:hypothetical protein